MAGESRGGDAGFPERPASALGRPRTHKHGFDSGGQITFLECWVNLLADGFQDVGLKETAEVLYQESVDFPLDDPFHRVGADKPVPMFVTRALGRFGEIREFF